MNVERELAQLIDDALGDDAPRSLAACRLLRAEHLIWLERRAVVSARRAGHSWAEIGRLLDMSKQNIHRRFRHLDGPTAAPPRPPHALEPQPSRAERLLAERDDRRRLAADLEAWEISGIDIVPW